MKRLLLATALSTVAASGAFAQDIKLGINLGFTGPLESVSPAMSRAAQLAMKEVSDSRKLLGGATVTGLTGDTGCIDANLATASAQRLINADGVRGIVGGMCSGETMAQLQNVARPNGMVMISASATSPALSTAEDDGLFFRTVPSDARQSVVMAEVILGRGFKTAAVTYTNNDYGKGLADSFAEAFRAAGGTVTIVAAHEDGKPDYNAEVGALASAGGDVLVVAGYSDLGGSGIIRASLDTGAFETFVLPDGMVGNQIVANFGAEINGSFGQVPASDGPGYNAFLAMATAAGFDGTSTYAGQAYDAAALIMLAMQAAKSSDPKVYKDFVFAVANGPGEPIMPGELGKALDLLAAGQDIDYVGATAVELIGPGESAGVFREIEIKEGQMVTVGMR